LLPAAELSAARTSRKDKSPTSATMSALTAMILIRILGFPAPLADLQADRAL
jgi:hypothetical protein